MKYGSEPVNLGIVDVECDEMMFYMYLPIKMRGGWFAIPDRLKRFAPMVQAATNGDDVTGKYIYLTAKHLYVTPDNPGNRPGWHSDGF